MREFCTYGSVRGALSNERPYRDRLRRRYAATPTAALLTDLVVAVSPASRPFGRRKC